MTRYKVVTVVIALLMLVAVFGAVYAQVRHETRLPAIYNNFGDPTPAPTNTPRPPTSGAILVADIVMPFNVLGGVDPSAAQDANGYWYISVFRLDSGANNGLWIVRWKEGETTATPIGMAIPSEAAPAVASAPLANSRGVVALDYTRKQLYVFGWQDKPGGSRKPLLRVLRVLDYQG